MAGAGPDAPEQSPPEHAASEHALEGGGGSAYHVPVLAHEVVAALREAPAGPVVDGTLGGGGHLLRLAEARAGDAGPGAPTVIVIGVDQDRDALAHAGARVRDAAPDAEVRVVRGNFRALPELLPQVGLTGDHDVAGILLDLGVSSWQLDAPERGFGFRHADAPLDMRMDTRPGQRTARELIADLDEDALAKVLREFGEVPQARRVARALKTAEAERRLETTGDLAALCERVLGTGRYVKRGRGKGKGRSKHPATTVFQALRIAVNEELDALDDALAAAPNLLMEGGRLAVISYHSLEDRRVKHAFRLGEQGPPRPAKLPPPSGWAPTWSVLTRKAIVPTEREVASNPRARSAKLRVAARAPLAGGTR